MAYNNRTQFPKSYISVANINQTAQTIFAVSAGNNVAISHIVVANGVAATKLAIFRGIVDTPEIVRVALPSGASIVIPGWRLDLAAGLEVIDTSNNTSGMYCTVFYVT